jgi:hypothetical protein
MALTWSRSLKSCSDAQKRLPPTHARARLQKNCLSNTLTRQLNHPSPHLSTPTMPCAYLRHLSTVVRAHQKHTEQMRAHTQSFEDAIVPDGYRSLRQAVRGSRQSQRVYIHRGLHAMNKSKPLVIRPRSDLVGPRIVHVAGERGDDGLGKEWTHVSSFIRATKCVFLACDGILAGVVLVG